MTRGRPRTTLTRVHNLGVSPPPPPGTPEVDIIYRHYDAAGNLLYLGRSTNWNHEQRQVRHAATAHWWPRVARIVTTEMPNGASRIEHRLIERERPVFNRRPLVEHANDAECTAQAAGRHSSR